MNYLYLLNFLFLMKFCAIIPKECLNHTENKNQKRVKMPEASHYLDDEGYHYPWYTKPFLDVLKTWDIQNWDIFEWGAGKSTVWYALHCKSITSIEHEKAWFDTLKKDLQQLNLKNVILKLRTPETRACLGYDSENDGYVAELRADLCYDGKKSDYVLAITEDDKQYDCIIIDGVHRNECVKHALSHIKQGGIIIVDNVDQASIGINSKSIFRLLKNYEHYSYREPDCLYPDWRTDYWIIQ